MLRDLLMIFICYKLTSGGEVVELWSRDTVPPDQKDCKLQSASPPGGNPWFCTKTRSMGGKLSARSRYSSGNVCRGRCKRGYVFESGNLLITCKAAGNARHSKSFLRMGISSQNVMWDKPPLKCKEKGAVSYCARKLLENLNKVGTSEERRAWVLKPYPECSKEQIRQGTKCSLSCNNATKASFQPMGGKTPSVTCSSSGKWSGDMRSFRCLRMIITTTTTKAPTTSRPKWFFDLIGEKKGCEGSNKNSKFCKDKLTTTQTTTPKTTSTTLPTTTPTTTPPTTTPTTTSTTTTTPRPHTVPPTGHLTDTEETEQKVAAEELVNELESPESSEDMTAHSKNVVIEDSHEVVEPVVEHKPAPNLIEPISDETKEGVEEVFEGIETFIVSLPTLYWILIWSGVALVIGSVVIALCCIKYRKNRKYTMVNTEGEQLIPAGSIQNLSYNNNRAPHNGNRNQNNHNQTSRASRNARLIPLEKVKLMKVQNNGFNGGKRQEETFYMTAEDKTRLSPLDNNFTRLKGSQQKRDSKLEYHHYKDHNLCCDYSRSHDRHNHMACCTKSHDHSSNSRHPHSHTPERRSRSLGNRHNNVRTANFRLPTADSSLTSTYIDH